MISYNILMRTWIKICLLTMNDALSLKSLSPRKPLYCSYNKTSNGNNQKCSQSPVHTVGNKET